MLELYLELVAVRATMPLVAAAEAALTATSAPVTAATAYEILELYLELVAVRATVAARCCC
jgi:hypothetical protein